MNGCYVYVYQLHFEQKIGRPQTAEERELRGLPPREGDYQPHCQHYIGATEDLPARIQAHRCGDGSKLTGAARKLGISFKVVRVWLADWEFEKQLKKRKEGPRLCLICNPGTSAGTNYGYKELTAEEIRDALIPF